MYRVYKSGRNWYYIDDSKWNYSSNTGNGTKITSSSNVLNTSESYQFYTTNDENDRFYYLKKARRENFYARENVYYKTVKEYKALKKEGFPFMLNSYRSTFEEEFAGEKYVSLTFDLYTFTGGAHGFTERTADTWDMKRGERVTLSEVCRECSADKVVTEV